jgi:hypothetical protein
MPDLDQAVNRHRSGRQCQACLDANEDCDLDKEAENPPTKEGRPTKKRSHLDAFSQQLPSAELERSITLQTAAVDGSQSMLVRSTTAAEGSEMLLVRLIDTEEGDVTAGSKEGANKVIYFGNDSIWSYSLEKARRTKTINSVSPMSADGHSVESNIHHPLPGAADPSTDIQVDLYANNEVATTLQKSDAFFLPPVETQRELLDAYIEWHYPLQPIIDKDDFIRDFESGQVSMLLLQALLSVATTCCEESVIQKHWSDRRAAQAAFYRRARALYDADHEQNRVTIVQALFFMCHWWGSPTEVKDFSHWLSTSIHIAQVMGMHRS